MAYILMLCAALAACRPAENERSIEVQLRVDGDEETIAVNAGLTVDQVLTQARIELGARDRISHPLVSLAEDGMVITIRRVEERQACRQQEIAFERLRFPREGVAAGETQLGQAGRAGLREVCYRVISEDSSITERIPVGNPVILREPMDEIVYVSTSERAQPLEIPGQLSYINHGTAWTISGNVVNKQPITGEQRLDSLVFSQSADGRRLLFTGETDSSDDFFNELWLIETDGRSEAVRLTPTDVLYADWRPYTQNVIAYSTGKRRAGENPWAALNNLWLVTIDLESGRALKIEEALAEAPGGLFGWWGTHFAWSPYGDKMAWARADGVGLVDFDEKRLETLVNYAVFQSATTWVWLTQLSWSYDNQLIAAMAHGAPEGGEPAEKSPIFDLAMIDSDGRFTSVLQESAGMWASPTFSPKRAEQSSANEEGFLAWLQAREPLNSLSGEYDLVVADRDGSNRRRLFPGASAPGVVKSDFGLAAKELAWSPDARFLALVYRGDLWLVAVDSGHAQQVTFDGGSSHPVWTL